MATDPNNPTGVPDNTTEQLDSTTQSATNAMNAFNSLNGALGNTYNNFNDIHDAMSGYNTDSVGMVNGTLKAMNAINNLTSSLSQWNAELTQQKHLSSEHRTELAAMTTAILGTREAYTRLGTGGEGLNTLGKQWQYLSDTITRGGGLLSDVVGAAEKYLGQKLPEGVKGSVGAINQYVQAMMRGTDNTLRMQNAMIQLAARSGNLTDVYGLAGDKLQNFNELVAQQEQAMLDSAGATNTNFETVQDYYNQLGTLTDALSSSVDSSNKMLANSAGDTSGRISLLSATILASVGSGRQYRDVIEDMRKAYADYGLTGEGALKFSMEMSKIAKDSKVDYMDVRNAIDGVADSMGRFADAGENAGRMSQGIAESMDMYVEALKNSGMSGQRAISTYQGITGAISQMSIAQKAFLSQQTGGAGGLMGAFQIEKMLKEGDVKGVMDKVRSQITRQAGQIVSVEEAANSPAAAARLTRQMELVKSGPLGQFAKTDQDAYRLLDAFKQMQSGKVVAKDFTDVLKAPMDMGLEIQKKSETHLQRIAINTEKARSAADTINTGTMQKLFTAGIGTNAAEGATQANLGAAMGTSATSSGRRMANLRAAMQAGQVATDTAGDTLTEQAGDLVEMMGQVGTGISDNVMSAKATAKKMIDNLMRKKETASPAQAAEIEKQLSAAQQQYNQAASAETVLMQARTVANNGTTASGGTASGSNTGAPSTNGTSGNQGAHKIDVNVHGICIECGQRKDNIQHAVSVNPTYNSR